MLRLNYCWYVCTQTTPVFILLAETFTRGQTRGLGNTVTRHVLYYIITIVLYLYNFIHSEKFMIVHRI